MAIQEKLLNIQTRLKVSKSHFNSFGNYNYRNCEDILEAVKPLLAEEKAAITLTDEPVLIGDWHYIKAAACFRDCDSIEHITVTAYAREDGSKKGMDSSQITGSTSSYARKYALNGLLAIDDAKDSDTTNNDSKISNESKRVENNNDTLRFINEKELAILKTLIDKKGAPIPKMLKKCEIKKLEEMSNVQYNGFLSQLIEFPDIPGSAPSMPDIPANAETPFK